MSKTVLIGCRLPSGIVLDVDDAGSQKVELNGLNTSMIAGGVGLTHVDEATWLFLKEKYKSHSAFTSQAVFAHKDSSSVSDVLALAEDLKGEKTGLEGIDPNAPAKGLEPEDKTKLKQELNKNAGVKPAPKKAKGAQDQAAAVEAATQQDQ